MKLVYKSVIGIVLVGLSFLIGNYYYERNWWEEDLKILDNKLLLKQLEQSVNNYDIMYFAESSNASTASTDSTMKSISELTNDCFPRLSIKAIEEGAIHAGVYKSLIQYIPDNSKVKAVIVTMNLRSFNSGWRNSIYENHCQHLMVAYDENDFPLYKKMRIVFKMYDYKEDWEREEDCKKEAANVKLYAPFPLSYKTVRDWDKALFHSPSFMKSDSFDNKKRELACHNVKTFAFNIDTINNQRIKDFDEIVDICKRKKLKLYFNILAENVQYADSLVGKELTELIKMNRDILMERYKKRGVGMIDNLESVDGKDYLDQHWTTEHYNQTGRIKIAKNVARILKKQFFQDYENCSY